MLDRLIDVIIGVWESLLPFTVVDQTEEALVLRLGRVHRKLGPGFHWTLPFFEFVLADHVITRVDRMDTQSVTTKDRVAIVVSATLQWRINDFEASVLKMEKIEDAIPIACYGVIRGFVQQHDWEALADAEAEGLNAKLKELCRKRVQRYGVLIEEVEISDLSRSRTIRLMQD